MVNYTEELFNAIKTISKKEVEALHFDTTVEVTVTDASKAHLGIYTVTNGSIYFTAYSTNTYKEKDRVLVMIPQGDYDQQKIIIGKKSHGDVDKPINYTEPFSQIIDVTNNLILEGIAEFGMIANGAERKWENSDTSKLINISGVLNEPCLIWSARPYPIEEEDGFKEEKGLTRIGLKADFKTLLKQFNTISGNYGLVLCVGFRNPDKQLTEDGLHSTIIQPFVFDSKDFFGNIYNFNAYYTQEAVFDISQYSDLILSDIFLFGYQKGNFKDINGKLIPSENVSDNIFINNYYICLGNDISEFKGDSLELYSFNETLFNKTNDNNSNSKNIHLRWIHQYETSNVVKALTNNEIAGLENYEVRWYRYKLGAPSPDSFMGAHWELITFLEDADKTTYQLDVDTTKEFERIQVAVIKDGVQLIARSNILEFTNEKEIVNNSLVKDINALSIRYDDDRHGNYFVYDSMQNVLNNEDTIIRKLTAVFADNIDNVYNKSELQNCESIRWIFPDSNSMIVPLDFNQDIIHFSNEDQEKTQVDDFWIQHINGSYIVSKDDLGSATDISKYTSIYYKINKNLNFNFGRNTIYLEVIKNGQTYIASITMQFNIAGTSGSEYTLTINWDNEKNTFDVNKVNEELSGHITLLDLQHSEVELNSEANYEYNWYKFNGTEHLTISHSNDNNSHFSISKTGELDINELYILEVKLINFGNYELITRMPIPLTQLYDNNNQQIFKAGQIEGPTTVRYAPDGLLAGFDKTPYNISLQKYNDSQWENIKDIFDVGYWKIIPEETSMAYLMSNSSATIDNIINFFIENNDDTNNYLRLLYRLIRQTTTIDSEQNFQLLDLEELVVEDVLNALNSTDQDQINNENLSFFQDDTGYQNLLSIIDNYKKCFNKNNNNNFLLSKLLKEIAFDSQPYTDISNLSGILTLKNWENFLKDTQLLPVTFYTSEIGLYGVQYVYNEEIIINGQTFKNIVLWTQPIYVYRDAYPSPTLNKWDGKLIIDNDNNTILVQGISAGRKEEDNTFSGVMFGDWTKDSVATPLTGIYGFNHGQMTYALQDNGSAFFGNDNGRISLNSDNSINLLVEENNNRVEIKPGAIIVQTREKATDQYQSLLEINKTDNKNIYLLQSQNFSDKEQTGMKIDLQNGQIKGYNFSLFSQTRQNNIDYSLELSSGQNNLAFIKIDRNISTVSTLGIPEENKRTNSALLNEAITETNEKILEIYNQFISMLSLFEELYELDDKLYSSTIQNIYTKILEFPNNNDLSTVTQLLDYIKSNESVNDSLILDQSGEFKTDWQNDWTFDELSNAFLFLLNDNQKKEIKQKLKLNFNIDDSFIQKRNLFFPKIPDVKLKDSTYNNTLYDNAIASYNELIWASDAVKINKIDEINSLAKALIKKYDLDSLHYSQQKISNNNKNYYYIKIHDGVLYPLNNLRQGTNTYTPVAGYHLVWDQTPDDMGADFCYPKSKFVKIGENAKGHIYKISTIIDSGQKMFVRYRETPTSTPSDFGGRQGAVSFSSIKHDQTAVDIYFANKDVMDLLETEGAVTDRRLVTTQNDVKYYLGMRIKDSNELIGKQKIHAKIQEKLNNYTKALTVCQDILNITNWTSTSKTLQEKHIWNFYYNTIQSLIIKINNTKNDKFYLTQFPKVLIPLDFSIRENLLIKQEDFINFSIEDGEQIRTCNKNDFIFLENNNLYSLFDDRQYYLTLYNSSTLRSYFHVYDNPETYSQVNNTEQKYQSLSYYSFINLGLLLLNKCEDIEQQQAISTTQQSSGKENSETWIFDQRNWNNALININQNGGYMTSKNYRPTMLENDKTTRQPTDSFATSPGSYSQGLKGFVLDFTNDRFVLGNNASIQGYQSQYYPGQTQISCRQFTISTGAKFITTDDRDKITTDNLGYFIRARMGNTPAQIRDIFTVDWQGNITCQGIKYNGKTVKLQGYTSTGYPAESGDSIAGYWLVVS